MLINIVLISMVLKITKNDFPKLRQRLSQIPEGAIALGEQWSKDMAHRLRDQCLSHLETQGRPGGEPPSLSKATEYLYEQLGEPDGSGIRDHIEVPNIPPKNRRASSVVGIPKGRPTMIGKVQDRGAVIPVTPKMRGWLAAHGIFLRRDTLHIVIPARNWWSSSLEENNRHAKREFSRRMKKL